MNELRNAIPNNWPPRNRIAAAVRLMGKVIRHPDRAVLRMVLWSRVALPGARVERRRLVTWVAEQFGVDAEHLSAEYFASDFHHWYAARRRELRQLGGPQRLGTSADLTLEALYLIVRLGLGVVGLVKPARSMVRPAPIYSPHSPAMGTACFTALICRTSPTSPRMIFSCRMSCAAAGPVVVGDSRCELPAILRRLSAIDLFYHDSLHTFQHMTWEYQAALPHLTMRGILSSHDVKVAHSVREKSFVATRSQSSATTMVYHGGPSRTADSPSRR